jgi:hypothetical protein
VLHLKSEKGLSACKLIKPANKRLPIVEIQVLILVFKPREGIF